MSAPENSDFPTKARLGHEFDRLLVADEGTNLSGRRLLILVPIAGLLAAVVAGVLLLGPGGDSSIGPSSAQAALHELADKVDTQEGGLTLSGDEVLYQREFDSGGQIETEADPIYVAPETYGERITEQWFNREGDSWFRIDEGNGAPTNLREYPAGNNGFAFLGNESLSYEEAISLPRDPNELYARLSMGNDVTPDPYPGSNASRDQIGNLQSLLDLPLPPDLQAALIDTAAKIPGVSLVGDVTTPFGDTLTAVSYPVGNGVRWELLFDPDSGSYRGKTIVLNNGARLYESLILDRSVVDAAGETPSDTEADLPPGEQGRKEEAAAETAPSPVAP